MTAVDGPVDLTQIFWPDGTVAPSGIRIVAAASENMSAPVAVTVASRAARGRPRWRRTPAFVLRVNGPSTLPAGPLTCEGVSVRLGGGGSTSGPSEIT